MKLLLITIPSISAFTILILGRYLGKKGGEIISKSSIIISMVISFISVIDFFQGKIITIEIKEWFNIGGLVGKLEIIYDKESIIMVNLISIITLVVIFYSYWYLQGDAHLNRFISLLLIFSVTMYILVLSKNLIFTFFGWEGVGIISFLLINFWSNSIQNSKSALKAIIFNKIGDIFYLLALIILGIYTYNYDYNLINLISNEVNSNILSIISFSLIFAAMAKSAQIFLHAWLGDAMAGPTPVSALLHAATMVTAGIYIILKTKILILNSNPIIEIFIILIGSLTILFAGITSLNQYDIKKVIAYSTCSQIGYMFFSLGLFKPYDSSLFHLLTHGFFKALLFLGAGLLIHSFLYEQDLRKYGLFIFKSPLFYIFFLIGSLAIMAIPPFSGFYSKDLILLHSLQYPYYFYIILVLGSIFSSLYSFKILFYSFFNSYYSNTFINSFHSLNSYKFLYPFSFLLFGSIFLGFLATSIFASPEILNLSLEAILNTKYIIFKLLPIFIPIIAIFILYIEKYYFSNFIFNNILTLLFPIGSRKFFFDNIYNYLFVNNLFISSYHFSYKFIDRGVLEFFGPISLFRLFFFFPKNYGLNSQYSTNIPYLFFYFFLALLCLFIPSLFFFSTNV